MDRLNKRARSALAGARGALARMEEREAVRAAVFACILLAVFALMLALNAMTPLEMDDYDYRISWSTGEPVSGVLDVLASQAAHYRLWGGRVVVHALAQLFLWLGKPVFNVANALMYVLLLLELYALARPRGRRFCWGVLLAAQAALFCCVPFFGTVFLWLTGACNYLWGTALALVPLLVLRSASEGGRFARGGAWGALAAAIGFFAGWTNENTAAAVFAVVLLALALRALRGERPAAWQWLMLAAQGIGLSLMLLAPGNFARAADVQGAQAFPVRLAVACGYGGFYLGVPALAALLFSGLLRALNLPARRGWAALLMLGALAGALALAASPVLSDRSYTGPFALALAAALTLLADAEAGCPALGAHRLCALPLCALLAVFGAAHAVRDVSAHAAAWAEQTQAIEQAASRGEEQAHISGVASHSRFTMDITLSEDPQEWPNASLSKAFGVAICGEQAENR